MKKRKQNSGIALIMVLGLLTVMIILAVTFAVSMRTERLAAGNAADNVRARELIHVGLARAMNDLAVNLGPTGLYELDGKAYPSWNVTNSYTNTDVFNTARWSTNVCLLATNQANEATNYVPRALWAEATNADLTNPSNHWLAVESIITNAAGDLLESNLMGRVAYIILNCSGLLDANYAGGGTRQCGTNPAEIAIKNLDEIETPLNLTVFTSDRLNAVRYETLAQLNSSMTNFDKQATNLFVYSRALPGYWSTNWNCVATQVNLSGGRAEVGSRSTEIFDALTEIGFVDPERGIIFRNLLDYIDTDSVPETDSVESVPMINEVRVECNVTVTPVGGGLNNYTFGGSVFIECWYPFATNADPSLSFLLDVTNRFQEAHSIQPNNIISLNYGIGTPTTNNPFSIVTLPILGSIPSVAPPIPPDHLEIISELSAIIKLSSGEIVDQLQIPIVVTNYHSGLVSSNTYTDAECLDPRFNFNPSDTKQWQQMLATNNSLNAVNTWTTSFLSSGNDNEGSMFVANRPLQSIAELGYLIYSNNNPWQTIKLYGPNPHRVLDVFGLSTNTSDIFMTNTVYRGLVNCNPNVATDATSVVFADMPVDQYPGEASGLSLDINQARSVADSIFNSGTYYTNLSDVGQNMVFPVGTTELEKESYFRNAFSLLNLRQNMFTIIIEAQAASGGNIPRNPAKQRAVAIVWRDPFTGEMFVRNIKWLGD